MASRKRKSEAKNRGVRKENGGSSKQNPIWDIKIPGREETTNTTGGGKRTVLTTGIPINFRYTVGSVDQRGR